MNYFYNSHEEFINSMTRSNGAKNGMYYLVPEYLELGYDIDNCWTHCNYLARYLESDFNESVENWYAKHVTPNNLCIYCGDECEFLGPSKGYRVTCCSSECISKHSTNTAHDTWSSEGHSEYISSCMKSYWTDEKRSEQSDRMKKLASDPKWSRDAFLRMCNHNGYTEAAIYVGKSDLGLKVGVSTDVESRLNYLGLTPIYKSKYYDIQKIADLEYLVLSTIPADTDQVEGEGYTEYRKLCNLDNILRIIKEVLNE